MLDILKDVRSGALPLSQIPGFLFWLLSKSFWFWIFVILAGMFVIAGK